MTANPIIAPRILHIEDNMRDAELVAAMIKGHWPDCDLRVIASERELRSEIASRQFDLILSDFSMPGFDGLSALALVRDNWPDTPFLFLSGTIGEDKAVEALKHGATDYIVKDRMNRLVPAVQRALAEVRQAALRRKAEARLRDQARWLDEARDAICVTDLNGRLTYWNRSAGQLFGWNDRFSEGRRLEEMLGLFNQGILGEAVTAVGLNGSWTGELQLTGRDGQVVTIESRWTMVRDASGRPESVLLISSDVTERRQLETQLRRAQRLDSLGMLAGGIAHDLNNLLVPIQIATDLLREDSKSPEVERLASMVTHSVERGGALIRQVLAFARGAEGDKQALQVALAIKDVARLLEETLPRSIELTTRVAPELWLVRADATQLSQVLMNLGVNARDAMPSGGQLLMQATNVEVDVASAAGRAGTPPGSYVQITVEDTGTGMPPEILDRIFDPFFTTKAIGKGTGLGLSMVRGIVKNHGGSIVVSSEPGRGTAFQLFLPAVFEASPAPVSAPPAPPKPGHGETLLVIDDERDIGMLLHNYLKHFGYKPIVAVSGEEGVALFRAHQAEIRAVITDMMMPGMQAPELVGALRAIDPQVRIVLMSGMVGPDGQERIAALKCEGFLQKPMKGEEIAHAIESVLERHS
ncbi:MAG TPA: response regulator [Candidatus Didemnitutus sp.]|nr:response regulator [Candidatus Didemnitutus sp.]